MLFGPGPSGVPRKSPITIHYLADGRLPMPRVVGRRFCDGKFISGEMLEFVKF